jgi:hypothetical protein
VAKAVYEIDGRDFTTEQFYCVVSRVLPPRARVGTQTSTSSMISSAADWERRKRVHPAGDVLGGLPRAAGFSGDGAATPWPANPLPPE